MGNAALVGLLMSPLAFADGFPKVVRDQLRLQSAGSSTGASQLHTLVLLDREIDFVTPMLTQLTYEGAFERRLLTASKPLCRLA